MAFGDSHHMVNEPSELQVARQQGRLVLQLQLRPLRPQKQRS